jgi:hypothetical protein
MKTEKTKSKNQGKKEPPRKTSDISVKNLVKVIDYNKVKKGDIVIIECEKGKENEFLAKTNEEFKSIIAEKDLRILAVTPDFDLSSLKHVVEVIRDICDKNEEEANPEEYQNESGYEL